MNDQRAGGHEGGTWGVPGCLVQVLLLGICVTARSSEERDAADELLQSMNWSAVRSNILVDDTNAKHSLPPQTVPGQQRRSAV
uniref:Uncharacterized protein n=1 Tax=Oryza sativa subsp. japonica TaxID=39947 RepID=Q5VPE4_ORYSJ|nr:hypothetical protein [Oryza sativa Japonica Group]